MFILERLIDVIAPNECLACSAEGNILCSWCRPEAVSLIPSRCYKCCVQTADSETCSKCRRHTPLAQVWVSTDYAGIAAQLVRQLKFEHTRQAAEVMAQCLDEFVPYLPPDTLVVHVPTANRRVRRRGFDHAALIAHSFAQQRSLRHSALLKRLGNSRQVGAKREERRKQLQDAFWVSKDRDLSGTTLVLIDDVLTTSATLEAAARTLKKAGAKSVCAAVFAQKLI